MEIGHDHDAGKYVGLFSKCVVIAQLVIWLVFLLNQQIALS